MKIFRFAVSLTLSVLLIGTGWSPSITADNQTSTISEIYPDDSLPFRIKLKKAAFELPFGVQSYIHGIHHDKFLIITGRVGGLHGFVTNSSDNFPVQEQNTNVIVVDPVKKKVYVRSLLDPESGLTQEQVDLLSVTAAQGYQSGKTLYIAGGYGVDSTTGNLNTKNSLTAINIPGLMHWVVHPHKGETAVQHMRQIFDDIFKVTGGYMNKIKGHPTLLIFGHEFNGFYDDPIQQPPVFQQYTEQVRRFNIYVDKGNLAIIPEDPLPSVPDPNYRRRDLNVVPIVKKVHKKLKPGFVALSGVFTPSVGIWTVPVEITSNGTSLMADPTLSTTFKQGMNNYDSATFGMYSEKTGDMYTLLLGGMSFGFFTETASGFTFNTDDEIPFISQTTTVRIDKNDNYTQYFMEDGGFPPLLSETVNAGSQLLFGSECEVFLLDKVRKYKNDVLKFDSIKKPTRIGYVIGGIMSTKPNTDSQADSMPSPYIFEVIVEPVRHHK